IKSVFVSVPPIVPFNWSSNIENWGLNISPYATALWSTLIASLFSDIFGQHHNQLSFDASLDLVGVVLNGANVFDYRSNTGLDGTAFYVERFCKYHGVAILQYSTISIFMQVNCGIIFMVAGCLSPGKTFIIEI